MFLPYVDNPPTNLNAEDSEVLARIQARRGPKGLIPLDLALLHSPPVADGWNSLLGAVRTKTGLDPDIRELAICRVAFLNEAWFEWHAHLPLLGTALETEGNVAERISALTDPDSTSRGPLSERQWTVLRYADAMTRHVKVDEALIHELRDVAALNDREIVELTALIASYNMVSRFLVALNVGEMNGVGPERRP